MLRGSRSSWFFANAKLACNWACIIKSLELSYMKNALHLSGRSSKIFLKKTFSEGVFFLNVNFISFFFLLFLFLFFFLPVFLTFSLIIVIVAGMRDTYGAKTGFYFDFDFSIS